jgi:hypothetical protein
VRDRTLVRLGIGTFVGTSIIFTATVVWSFILAPYMTSSDWGSAGIAANLLLLAVTFTFPLVGSLIVRRQPRNAVGWVMLAIGVVWTVGLFADNYAGYGVFASPGSLPRPDVALALTEAGWIPGIALIGIYLVLLFPDGHLPSPRWRVFAWVTGGLLVLSCLAITFEPGRFVATGFPQIRNPFGLESLRSFIDALQITIFVVPLGLLAGAMGLRQKFRRSRGKLRMQMKWFVAAAGWTAAIYAIGLVATFDRPNTSWVSIVQNISLFSFVLIPIATGIAILKFHLYEIDRLVNRTLVYLLLTAILAGAYAGLVFAFQALLAPVTAESDLAVAASTLAVAALFRPVRARVQAFIDRRFYRRKIDVEETIERFGTEMRDEVDLGALSARLTSVVSETMQPAHVSLWLREASR